MTDKNRKLSLVEQATKLISERVTTGGGATGATQGPVAQPAQGGGAHANRPQDKNQGDPMHKGQNPAGIAIQATSTENNTAPTGDMSDQNRGSVAMKSVKEDVDAIFNGTDVSEEFKTKAATIFEAAVNARVAVVKEELEAGNEAQLVEAVAEIKVDLEQKLNDYLEYSTEQWLEQNAIAVESGLRAEISESFMSGLKELFTEHYINVPEDQIDVAEEMAKHIDALEAQLNDVVNENIELNKIVESAVRESVVEEVTAGLVETQKAKLATLFEGVEFTTPEEFKAKLETIKSGYSENKQVTVKAGIQSLLEQVTETPGDAAPAPSTDPAIRNYVSAISRTAKGGK